MNLRHPELAHVLVNGGRCTYVVILPGYNQEPAHHLLFCQARPPNWSTAVFHSLPLVGGQPTLDSEILT